jgi:sensor histidine kinase regulating citrate/malate metabolism
MLGAKIFQASKNQIRITCVADGKLLDFMHVTDICTIFGNALDNAIENAVLIEDPEKRMIHVTVSAQKSFVLINISNYFEGKIELKNNALPKTTKHDKCNHGFGLKSIGYAVEKYNGTMSVSAENNWFELKILMPQNGK